MKKSNAKQTVFYISIRNPFVKNIITEEIYQKRNKKKQNEYLHPKQNTKNHIKQNV